MGTFGAENRTYIFPSVSAYCLKTGISLNWKLVTSARQDTQLAVETHLSPCPLGNVM